MNFDFHCPIPREDLRVGRVRRTSQKIPMLVLEICFRPSRVFPTLAMPSIDVRGQAPHWHNIWGVRKKDKDQGTLNIPPCKNVFCSRAGMAMLQQRIFRIITKVADHLELLNSVGLTLENTVKNLRCLRINLLPVYVERFPVHIPNIA